MNIMLNQKINELPVHDSDFTGIRIDQNEDGDADLKLGIIFYDEDSSTKITDHDDNKFVKKNNYLVFKKCRLIEMKFISNQTRRDLYDYIDVVDNPPLAAEYNFPDSLKRVEVAFISGPKITCLAQGFELA